jgi:predicted nucleic acid-binding protein
MVEAICNTSPLLYLHRIGGLPWLSVLFRFVITPIQVVNELAEGRRRGFDVPNPAEFAWIRVEDPRCTPSEWLSLDLGPGELAAMALALENPDKILLLDDAMARRTAQAAGLKVWGCLKILLEAKSGGLIENVAIPLDRLIDSGMWVSTEVRQRILILAGEKLT